MTPHDLAKEWLRYAIDGYRELSVEYEKKNKRIMN
jgi:hypothetical protein